MHLTEILDASMIWPSLKATSKEEVIRELATNIAKNLKSVEDAQISKILFEREQLGSTGIQDGIAIPHGKIPGLERILIGCGRSLEGINFDAHDAKPTHLFFVLLAPEFAAGQHLKALSRLSRLLKDARFRERLLGAPNAEEMYKIITIEDEKI